jgi:uncharacterized membrane protein YhfC
LVTLVQPSPALLVSGMGMMIVGLAPVVYWRKRSGVSWKVFGLAAVAWLSVTVLKAIADILVTPSVGGAVQGSATLATALVYGLYAGLETGVFETGFTLIWARRFRLFNASFEDAVGFGLGFACVEALALGLSNFLGILEILMNPAMLGTLDPSVQQALSAQYALGPALIGAPIIERISALFIDCFTVVMVFMAIRGARGVFPIAALYASLADFSAPLFNVYLSSTTLANLYLLEIPYVLLGSAGVLGLLRSRMDPVFSPSPPKGGKPHAR